MHICGTRSPGPTFGIHVYATHSRLLGSREIILMTVAEVMEIGNTDPQRLISLMRSAARHDPTLSPRLPEDEDGGFDFMTAMAWKLSATVALSSI